MGRLFCATLFWATTLHGARFIAICNKACCNREYRTFYGLTKLCWDELVVRYKYTRIANRKYLMAQQMLWWNDLVVIYKNHCNLTMIEAKVCSANFCLDHIIIRFKRTLYEKQPKSKRSTRRTLYEKRPKMERSTRRTLYEKQRGYWNVIEAKVCGANFCLDHCQGSYSALKGRFIKAQGCALFTEGV